MKNLRFCIFGRGSMGARHVRNLKSLDYNNIVAFSEKIDRSKDELFKNNHGVETIHDIQKLCDYAPDAAIIANPTSEHLKTASKALNMGCHIFMEKPMSHKLTGITQFKKKILEVEKVFLSANCLRFHIVVETLKNLIDQKIFGDIYFSRIQVGQYLPDWHPNEDYKKSYAARSDLGGGAVLTLQHEIDYAYWMFGEFLNIKSFVKKTSKLNIDVEDVASVIIETKTGQLIEIHLDFLQRPPKRSIQIQGSKGSVDYCFGDRYLKFYDFNKQEYINIIDIKDYDANQMYLSELKHFIKCINGQEKPRVDLDEAIYVLKACIAIKKGRCFV